MYVYTEEQRDGERKKGEMKVITDSPWFGRKQ